MIDFDDDEGLSNYMVCRFCGLPWGDHEHTCPYGGGDRDDSPDAHGRQEDRVYRDPREREEWGP